MARADRLMKWIKFVLTVLLAATLAGALCPHSVADTPDASAPESADTLQSYILADLPSDTLAYDGERFQVRPFVALVGDYTFF